MAPTAPPRRLDEAPRPGGLTYTVSGQAIDSEGRPLEGAPTRPDDTPEHEQPYAKLAAASTVGATGVSGGLDMKALGSAIAEGLTQATGRAAAETDARKTADAGRDKITAGAKDSKPSGAPAAGDPTR